MNWDAVGAIAEAVGALAILVTLIYLTLQVRQAKLASADTNRLMRASGVREMTLTCLQDKELRETVYSAYGQVGEEYLAEFSQKMNISVDKAEQLDLYTQYYQWLHWGQFSTTMTAADERELRQVASQFYNVPAFRYAWENSMSARGLMDSDFVTFIDSVLVDEPTH